VLFLNNVLGKLAWSFLLTGFYRLLGLILLVLSYLLNVLLMLADAFLDGVDVRSLLLVHLLQALLDALLRLLLKQRHLLLRCFHALHLSCGLL